jgi:hypothetical protein
MYQQLLYVIDNLFNHLIQNEVGHACAGYTAGQETSVLSQPRPPDMVLDDGPLIPVCPLELPQSPGVAGASQLLNFYIYTWAHAFIIVRYYTVYNP